MATQPTTVYIPRVHPNTEESDVREQFEYYSLANVLRVDWVFKYDDGGKLTFKQAFVHLVWMHNDTALRLKDRIENGEQSRLVYDDPKYWILLQARNPLPQSVVDDSKRLIQSGNIGDILDRVLTLLPDGEETTRDQFRAIGLAFNTLRQQQLEEARKYGINQTLLAATVKDLEFYRGWHDAMHRSTGAAQASLCHYQQAATERLTELVREQEKSEALERRIKHLEEQLRNQCAEPVDAEAPWKRHGATCVDGEIEAANDYLRQQLDESNQIVQQLQGYIRNQAMGSALTQAPLNVRTDREGDDPIAARARASSPADNEWDVVPDALDEDTAEGWRIRRQYRYGEDTDSDDDSCSSMPGLEEDSRPVYTKEMHLADTRVGRAQSRIQEGRKREQVEQL